MKKLRSLLEEVVDYWTNAPPRVKLTVCCDWGQPPEGMWRVCLAFEEVGSSWIMINQRKRMIEHGEMSDWLFGRGKESLEDKQRAFLRFPIAMIAADRVRRQNEAFIVQENLHGMSRHCIALLDALCEQVTAEELALLTDAFRNTWAHERYVETKVSVRQAAALLSRWDLTASRHRDSYSNELGLPATMELHWYDDVGNLMAEARVKDPERAAQMRVLGSTFARGEVDRLCNVCRCYTIVVDGTVATEQTAAKPGDKPISDFR